MAVLLILEGSPQRNTKTDGRKQNTFQNTEATANAARRFIKGMEEDPRNKAKRGVHVKAMRDLLFWREMTGGDELLSFWTTFATRGSRSRDGLRNDSPV